MQPCSQCGQLTGNPKFCGRSCATTANNLSSPRKCKQGKCQECGVSIVKRNLFCEEHRPFKDWSKVTLQEVRGIRSYQANSRIRQVARANYLKSDRPKNCKVCGYSKHIEVCHVKPISKFSSDTPISEINKLDNLVALCPNHHWELDNEIPLTGFEPV